MDVGRSRIHFVDVAEVLQGGGEFGEAIGSGFDAAEDFGDVFAKVVDFDVVAEGEEVIRRIGEFDFVLGEESHDVLLILQEVAEVAPNEANGI